MEWYEISGYAAFGTAFVIVLVVLIAGRGSDDLNDEIRKIAKEAARMAVLDDKLESSARSRNYYDPFQEISRSHRNMEAMKEMVASHVQKYHAEELAEARSATRPESL